MQIASCDGGLIVGDLIMVRGSPIVYLTIKGSMVVVSIIEGSTTAGAMFRVATSREMDVAGLGKDVEDKD